MTTPANLNQLADPLARPASNFHERTAFGAEELVVSQSVDFGNLRQLLECLVREDCAHSWKNFGPEGTLERLLQWENELRPTQLFFFYLRRGGEMRLAAAGAVADRLIRGFPHPGFCVLGRCYVMPEYRGHGLYRRILQYRLDYCRSRFGNKLNAIHVGSDNDRVGRVVINHRLPGWPRFVHLGDQKLQVDTTIKTVGAYLLLDPAYLDRIQDSLAGAHAPACVTDLRNALSRIETGDIRHLGAIVKQTVETAGGRKWFESRDCGEIEKLMLLCRSIPLVGF